MKRNGIVVALVIGCLFVAGCGDTLDGTYESEGGVAKVEFKSGKAYFTTVGITTEADYEVKNDKITFRRSEKDGGNAVMNIESDGTLTGPLGLKLTKKKT